MSPRRHIMTMLAWLVAAMVFAGGQAANSATLTGSVRDSHERPVSGATVYLEMKVTGHTVTTQTDWQGSYRFVTLSGGTYSLRVETSGYGQGIAGPLVVGPEESKNADIRLEPAFLDEPKFTVAGVTDGGHGGVHASDAVRSSTETLAKATASLDAELRDEKPGNALEAVRKYQRAAELNASEQNFFEWGAELLKHRAAEPAAEVFRKGTRLFPHSTRPTCRLAWPLAVMLAGLTMRLRGAFSKPPIWIRAIPSLICFLAKCRASR